MLEYLNMLDQRTLESPDAQRTVVGTGPFTFVEWVQGDHIRLAKNRNYWQSGRPYVDELNFQITKDAPAAVAALEAGAADAFMNPPVRDAARLQKDARFTLLVNKASGITYILAFNTLRRPLDDKRVRQAINYGIDRKRFAETVLLGLDAPQTLPWPPHSPAYEPEKDRRYAFDLDRTRGLLSQAGVSVLDLDLMYVANETENAALAQIMQADLAKAGVRLNLRAVDLTSYSNTLNSGGPWTLATRLSGFAAVDPVTMFTSGNYYRPGSNTPGFKSDRYTQLVDAASVEPDLAKRRQIYAQLNDLMLDEMFMTSLAADPPMLVTRAAVRGAFHSLHEAVIWTDTWIA